MKAIDKAIKIAGSQSELARKSGLSQACISKLSSGKTKMTAPTATKIERAVDKAVTRNELCPDIFDEVA